MSVNAGEEAESTRQRIEILGFPMDQVSSAELMQWCHAQVEPQHIVTLNLNYLTLVRNMPKLAKIVRNADMVVADAMPLVRVASWLNQPFPEKITGHDLVERSAEHAAKHGLGVLLLGGGPGVANSAAETLSTRYPGLRIKGTDHGGFDANGVPDDKDQLFRMVHEFQPHFLFVALGVPKQDYFIAEHLEELKVPVTAGIGCVFDVLAGNIKRAPDWMQRASLEWLFQMLQEPKRLWKRFILGCIPTAVRLGWFTLKTKFTAKR